MILNTKRIHNFFWGNLPARAKQMSSKVLFAGKKKRRQRPFGHYAPKLLFIFNNSNDSGASVVIIIL